ncbi:hypothetical protein FRC12_022684 [Ceratobasidium sp. 428]|nr:hypothetical protein FRC12_022684 [Ceratobasidium sp. 428]
MLRRVLLSRLAKASLAYPTPAQTVWKAANESNAMDLGTKAALPAPKLEAAVPQPRAQEIVIGSSDEEDDEEEALENEEEWAAGDASSDEYKDSGDSEHGERVCKGREGEDSKIELAIHIPAHLEKLAGIDEYAAQVQAKYSKTGKLPSKPRRRVPVPPKPVVSQPAPGRLLKGKAREVLKVEEEGLKMAEKEVGVKVKEDMKIKVEPSVMTDAHKPITCNYTLKCFSSMCGLEHADELDANSLIIKCQ